MGDRVHFRRRGRAAGGGLGAPDPHELRDQHGIGLVIADVIVVGGPGIVIERHEVPRGIQSSAHLDRECRGLRIPRRLFVPHPLNANRPADLFRQIRRLASRIVGGGAAVTLRAFHPDDAHFFARHPEKSGDARSHAIRLHVIGIDRHLAVRRIRHGMRRTDRRVPLERDVVIGFDDLRRARERRVRIAHHDRARSWTWALRRACT